MPEASMKQIMDSYREWKRDQDNDPRWGYGLEIPASSDEEVE